MTHENPIWWFQLEPALRTLGLGPQAGITDVEHAYNIHVNRCRLECYPAGSPKREEIQRRLDELTSAYRKACDILSHPDMAVSNMLEMPRASALRDRFDNWRDR